MVQQRRCFRTAEDRQLDEFGESVEEPEFQNQDPREELDFLQTSWRVVFPGQAPPARSEA